MSDTRNGGWCQTFSGVAFYPFDPRASEVKIVDIAHALALQCRFAGHCRVPYSVAEHSVRVARLHEDRHAEDPAAMHLGALLHDAAEAYLVDLPRPIKHDSEMRAYRDAEHALQSVIAEAFGLHSWKLDSLAVKVADETLLATEARDLMAAPPMAWGTMSAPLPERIEPWGWERAEREFLARFEELMARQR